MWGEVRVAWRALRKDDLRIGEHHQVASFAWGVVERDLLPMGWGGERIM